MIQKLIIKNYKTLPKKYKKLLNIKNQYKNLTKIREMGFLEITCGLDRMKIVVLGK